MRFIYLTSLLMNFVFSSAFAESLLNVKEMVEVKANAQDVWAKIGDFGNIAAWHPAITATEIIDGENNQRGAIRAVTLHDGGALKEKLISYDPVRYKYVYTMVDGALPVSGFQSYIMVQPVTSNISRIFWSARFKPTGVSNEEALNTVSLVYRDGLNHLKGLVEADTP